MFKKIKDSIQNFINNKIQPYMNDNDRGPGHAIGNSLFYGCAILCLAPYLHWGFVLALLLANHWRCYHQEWNVEGWKHKWRNNPDIGDLIYDMIFRPLATDAFVIIFGYLNPKFWVFGCVLIFLLAWKKKNGWPFFTFKKSESTKNSNA